MSRVSVVRTDGGRFPELSKFCRDKLFEVMPEDVHFIEITQSADTCYEYPNGSVFTNNSNFFVNLLCGLNQCLNGPVFIIDYDCLYPKGYFDHHIDNNAVNVTNDMIYLSHSGFFPRKSPTTSVVCGHRDLLRELIWRQLREWNQESATIAKTTLVPRVFYSLDCPAVDIRHGRNWSGPRGGKTFKHHPYWGNAEELYLRATGIKL